MIGKQALSSPSTTDHSVMPTMLACAYFSGTMPKAGAANSANTTVTISVMIALL